MAKRKPPLRPQVTTLWDYPSQHYGKTMQGDRDYKGATPSYVIWNLLQRYTRPGNLVVDPCCGSGTTLDVAADCGRKALGFDLTAIREDITPADARDLPMDDASADFVFIDPPYSTHIHYSDDPRCIGNLDAADGQYYRAMEQVFEEIHRILKPDRHMALYVCDSYVHNKGFFPLGMELFARLCERFEPVDIISVVRHNRTLTMGNYRKAAEEGNFFLRGFNYLFIMHKPPRGRGKPATRGMAARGGKHGGGRTGRKTDAKARKSGTGRSAGTRRKGNTDSAGKKRSQPRRRKGAPSPRRKSKPRRKHGGRGGTKGT